MDSLRDPVYAVAPKKRGDNASIIDFISPKGKTFLQTHSKNRLPSGKRSSELLLFALDTFDHVVAEGIGKTFEVL